MLRLEKVAWNAPGGAQILRDVSFELGAGEMIWLGGPSGGGKTSLLRLLNRLADASRGRIEFLDRAIEDWQPSLLRRKAALLTQKPHMFPGSIMYNLTIPFELSAGRHESKPPEELVAHELRSVGMADVPLTAEAGKMSIGQQQRAAFLRLLVMAPRLLLLDEPLAPLDPEASALVQIRLARFLKEGGSAIMVSHIRPTVPHRPCLLRNGVLTEGAGYAS